MNYSQALTTLKIKINEKQYFTITISPLDDLSVCHIHSKRLRKLITLDGCQVIEVLIMQYSYRESTAKGMDSKIHYDSRTKYSTIQNDDMVKYKNYSKTEIQETLGKKYF